MSKEAFTSNITKGYSFEGESIVLGAGILEGEPVTGCHVKLPLKTMNRHGLIAGACLLYTSPSPRDGLLSRMPSSA